MASGQAAEGKAKGKGSSERTKTVPPHQAVAKASGAQSSSSNRAASQTAGGPIPIVPRDRLAMPASWSLKDKQEHAVRQEARQAGHWKDQGKKTQPYVSPPRVAPPSVIAAQQTAAAKHAEKRASSRELTVEQSAVAKNAAKRLTTLRGSAATEPIDL
jgi:hypothetical protein